tara:strand:- start:1158 stop:1706 length:549 start_codon:yes stop_codon:yes gene_type:complete
MYIAKRKQIQGTVKKYDKVNPCKINIKNGVVRLECSRDIMGIELYIQGKNKIESLLPKNWLIGYNGNKVILVDISGKGIKTGDLFFFGGNLYITRALAVTTDQEIIMKYTTNDKHLYEWDSAEGNDFGTGTTNWDNLKSENIHISKKKVTNEVLNLVPFEATGVFEEDLASSVTGYGTVGGK